MMTVPDDELSPEEQRAYASLRATPAPPMDLEARVIGRLRAGGQIVGGRGRVGLRYARPAAWLAAAAALFVAGFMLGSRGAATPEGSPAGPRFVLLLHEGPEFQAPESGRLAGRVEEYRQWARSIHETGHLLSGEKLEDGGRILEGAAGAEGAVDQSYLGSDVLLGGYFVITAADYAEAVAIARGCPHLRYGGRIEVRRIEPT